LAAALFFTCSIPGWAQPDLVGEEFRVNQNDEGRPINPIAAFSPAGNALIVWEHEPRGIVGRFFDRNGVPSSAELVLVANQNLPTIPARGEVLIRKDPALLYLPNGELLLFWTEQKDFLDLQHFYSRSEIRDQDVYGQRYDASGAPLGERFRVNGSTAGFQSRPKVALKTGGIVVVWEEAVVVQGDYVRSVHARLLTRRGQPTSDAFRVDSGTSSEVFSAAVAANAAGDFLVTWEALDEHGSGVMARAYDKNGVASGPAFGANTSTFGHQRVPAVLATRAGDFLVAWQSYEKESVHHGIYGQFFDKAGSPVGSEILISGGFEDAALSCQYSTALAQLPGGDILVSWMDYLGPIRIGVYMVVIDEAGRRQGDDVLVSRERVYIQKRTAMAVNAQGEILSAWEGKLQRERGITARLLRVD
jgi:hypothetical protein